ncbi:hypothetical protein CXB51_024183 [Gossypium anomalum]|uniref:Aminotransferase-like plant mobile domain-containing protein n=1 Tax=Gossypium anomalum TaxID=47600 RepID=A0A8J5YD73_9ROSI|nr:hypothetical protein CXB51_024183 [Gossypium anomalum]
MRNEYLDKVEDNASVCTWSEKTQLEKEDSVTEGYTSELWEFTRVNSTQNEFHELFGDVDLAPTLEEYTTLLRCPKIQGHKAYVRPASLPTFTKKLVMITGMSEQWAVARVQQKGDKYTVPAILAETIRSLSACRGAGEGRFIGCAQLLLVWFHSHFWKLDRVPCRVFSECYSPLKEVVDMPRRDDISEERWIDILQNL